MMDIIGVLFVLVAIGFVSWKYDSKKAVKFNVNPALFYVALCFLLNISVVAVFMSVSFWLSGMSSGFPSSGVLVVSVVIGMLTSSASLIALWAWFRFQKVIWFDKDSVIEDKTDPINEFKLDK